jgi:hypothetical protein
MKPRLFALFILFPLLTQAHTDSSRSAIVVADIRDTLPAPSAPAPIGPLASHPDPDDDRLYTSVGPNGREAAYIGGEAAWNHLVDSALAADKDALHKDRRHSKGTCQVQFIVAGNGTVSDVTADNMQDSELARLLVGLIQTHPVWTPASINGHSVKAFRLIKVTFTGQ